MKKNLVILILLLILATGISYYLKHSVILMGPGPQIIMTATSTPVDMVEEVITVSTTMKIKIALLGTQMETSNKDNFRGCDVLVFVERQVPSSSMPLTAAIRELFSKKDVWTPNDMAPGNFISSQKELFFDKVVLENTIARIYLIGKVGPLNGVCDDPRLRIQLEETALQFPSVKAVEFYLNGLKTDLTFSQR